MIFWFYLLWFLDFYYIIIYNYFIIIKFQFTLLYSLFLTIITELIIYIIISIITSFIKPIQMIKLHITMIAFIFVKIHIIRLILFDIPFLFTRLVIIIIIVIIITVPVPMSHFIIIIMLIFLFFKHFLIFFSGILTTFLNSPISSIDLYIVFLWPPGIPFIATIILLIIVIEVNIRFLVPCVNVFIFRVFRDIVTVV